MTQPAIELRAISRLIPQTNRPLLDEVNFAVHDGDRIGLAGVSGSGKTTLLRSIAGLDPVANGTLHFDGETVMDWPAYRRQVIYLHQRPAMKSGNVRENLQLPFEYRASAGRYDEPAVTEWLDRLGKPTSILDQPVDTLSGGEQQMIALLRAIQLRPRVLLFDEPTASLDRDSEQHFERLVEAWWDSSAHRALIWTSHDDLQRTRMTDRIVTIRDGQVRNVTPREGRTP